MTQDFTKPQQVSEMPTTEKNKRWLTKNRFWNFVFWIGMSGGFSLAFFTSGMDESSQEFSYWSSFILYFTLFAVPLTVRHFSKTTFIKDDTFLDIDGNEFNLSKHFPDVFLTVVTTAAITALTGLMLDNTFRHIPDSIGITLICIILFMVPTSFFIVKDCPISILFNRKMWHIADANDHERHHKSSDSSRSSSNLSIRSDRNNIITNPAYKSLSSNIHHRHRR